MNQSHPQFNSHTFKLKYKPFKVNLLGPQFLLAKHEKEEPEEFAKCVLLFFKPWLKTPLTLKSHSTWTKSLKEWDFYSRHLTDKRWYLKVSEKGINPTHPMIENIRDMFKGQDLAARQRMKILEDLKSDEHNIESQEDNSFKITDVSKNEKESGTVPLFINNNDVIYLPKKDIRKFKIAEHIRMVTSDILKALKPPVKKSKYQSKYQIPKEIYFNNEDLKIITKSWEKKDHHTDNKIDKYNSISTLIPQNHPFRNLLFDYVPKNKRITWNEDQKKKTITKNIL